MPERQHDTQETWSLYVRPRGGTGHWRYSLSLTGASREDIWLWAKRRRAVHGGAYTICLVRA